MQQFLHQQVRSSFIYWIPSTLQTIKHCSPVKNKTWNCLLLQQAQFVHLQPAVNRHGLFTCSQQWTGPVCSLAASSAKALAPTNNALAPKRDCCSNMLVTFDYIVHLIIIIIITKSYIAHVSTNKLSIYIYTEREVIKSYEFWDPIM